ncbi:MAG: hypothetical protein L6R40_006476 [Gallowayella cf. fulva]|nr:MAG: hypothetical protein L6R40_006476 [Xanthomendoza cf. fulva]
MLGVSRPAIERHRAEKYSTFRFGPPCFDGIDKFMGSHPLFLLDKILSDPSIAAYVTELQVSECTSDRDEQYYHEDLHDHKVDRLKEIAKDRWHEIAAQCFWLSDERRQDWHEALTSINNQPHFIGILLTMLPNLESITLTSMTGVCGPILEIVNTAAAANRSPDSLLHRKGLTKLLEISLDRAQEISGEDFGIYAPFTALPSMRSLHGRMVAQDHDHTRAQPPRNDIEEIKIICGAVDLGSWDWMLKSIKNLKRFAYHHHGYIVGFATYDSRGIVGLLRQYASHSLRRLDLTTDEIRWDRANPYIGDLKDFKVLRILRLDDTSFQTTTRQIMRLIDMLPASIRVVRLLREASGDAADLFQGLAEGKQQRQLELKRVHLEGYYDLPFSLVEKCREAAIEISGPGLKLY